MDTLSAENVQFTNVKSAGTGRNSSVGIATGYGVDGPGIES
jgi:hypothetical protein